jgi:predicted small secreted protein
MIKHHRSAFIVLGLAFASLLFSGCNTMRGLGEDTERAGEEIQEAAR